MDIIHNKERADELVMCIMQIDEHIKPNELKIRTLVNTNEELNDIKREFGRWRLGRLRAAEKEIIVDG